MGKEEEEEEEEKNDQVTKVSSNFRCYNPDKASDETQGTRAQRGSQNWPCLSIELLRGAETADCSYIGLRSLR